MTDCPDSTLLRTHLDHPEAALDAHLDACDTCAGLLLAVAADAGATRQALDLLDPDHEAGTHTDLDIDGALAAVLAEAAPASPVGAPVGSRRRRVAAAGRRHVLAAAAALVVVAAVVTPGGRSAVASALDVFRGERLQPVSVDLAAWAASFDDDDTEALEALGEVDTSGLAEPDDVADIAEAEEVAGVDAPTLAGEPDHVVALAPGTFRLVLEAREGNGVPDDLDGAALVVSVPGAVGAVYGPDDGPPETVVGRSGPLVVRAEGASLDDLRTFVLGRDELPDGLRDQLTAIDDWRSTIPVPVPLDGPGWAEVEVAGRPAVAFGDDSGVGALVLRQDPGGVVTVVGGRMGVNRALELAERA